MCGLYGSISNSKINNIESILKTLRRRGPDGEAHFQKELSNSERFNQLTFCHTRLSILGPGPQGQQPMFLGNETESALIYNGEIYNYIELRQELQNKGINFDTETDTEVLLKGIASEGISFTKRLRGIFSFLYWCEKEEKLFFARDPMGVKPLYYCKTNEGLYFASEVSTLLTQNIDKKLDNEEVLRFLNFGSSLGDNTIFESIKSIPAGNYGHFGNDELIIEPYWEIPTGLNDKLSPDESIKLIRNTFLKTIELQMRSDVEVGAFLSGGMDSGLLTGLMSQLTKKPLQTFSIGFEGRSDLLEWSRARKTAERIKSNHNEVMINQKEFDESISDFLEAIDHPSVDGLNSYFVSKFTGKSVKVAISGLGGDELFCGYPIFHQFYYGNKTPKLFQHASKFLPQLFLNSTKLANFTHNKNTLVEILKDYRKIKPSITGSELKPYLPENLFSNEELQNILGKYELQNYTIPMLLRDTDAVSMHHGLEVRVPFLDQELVSATMSVAPSLKFGDCNKHLLVKAFPDVLDPEIIKAPKLGFEMPVGSWIEGRFSKSFDELTSFFKPLSIENTILESIDQFNKNNQEYLKIWRFVVLKEWMTKNNLELPTR